MKKATTEKDAPVKLRGYPMQSDILQQFMTEWSRTQAEINHVETIEEANDFGISEDDDEDFFQGQTVYEMHDQAEENLEFLTQQQALAESNETGDQGEDPPPHAQSAPVEPNSLEPNQTPPLSDNQPDITNTQPATAAPSKITINN